jgi:heavy metal translocating P-type ATPase
VPDERFVRRALVGIALGGLTLGTIAYLWDKPALSNRLWSAGALPVIIALAVSIIRDFRAGRMGVDAVALLSMTAALALGEALAAAVVAVMYAGGNLLEDFAVSRAERDLKALIDRAPRAAHRRCGELIEDVPIEAVARGDAIVVRGGEVIPVDGVVMTASASIDESALTGEPIPIDRSRGERVFSGTLNAGDTFEMKATAAAGQSTYAGIVRMVTAAQTAKAPFIRLADRYALILLPVSVLLAGGAWFYSGDPIRGLAVLVAATPCPLILAAPVAFISGVSQAARHGVLVKGGAALEALARASTVMFDKTGTLTLGGARLVAIETAPGEPTDDVLRLAASLEQASQHVIAQAIVASATARGLRLEMPEDIKETMGSGLEGMIAGSLVRAGSHQLVRGSAKPAEWEMRALRRASWRSALSVFVSVDGRVIGALLLADEVRKEAPRTIQSLRRDGINRIVMLTGDRADAAETIAAALDVDAVMADCAPSDKVEAVGFEQRRAPTLMVGDGINDAPALAAASAGVAMGARGASASSEAADVVILVDRLDGVAKAVRVAKRANSIARQSVVVGMGLSGIAMLAAAGGWLSPVAGALIQEVIDVTVILNALRALTLGRQERTGTLPASSAHTLVEAHREVDPSLARLQAIADFLDTAEGVEAVALINEADRLVAEQIVAHEVTDEGEVYPRLLRTLPDNHGLNAMSRAHREILHKARLLSRLSKGLLAQDADRYLVRDAQRLIESIESLVRLHNAQEDDIYEYAAVS